MREVLDVRDVLGVNDALGARDTIWGAGTMPTDGVEFATLPATTSAILGAGAGAIAVSSFASVALKMSDDEFLLL